MGRFDIPTNPDQEKELIADILDPEMKENPLQFVRSAFPWGAAGTPLEGIAGPRQWQTEILQRISSHLKSNTEAVSKKLDPSLMKLAVSSGRGIGKSALVSMIVCWLMSCYPGITVVIAANSESQLRSRTWAEIGKWHSMLVNSHWFERQSMKLSPAPWYGEVIRSSLGIDPAYYYAEGQLWSEERPDAFAGVHNTQGFVLIFDEASGIPPAVWEVSEGFFTEKTICRFWLAFSNPRRNTGRFYDCFHNGYSSWQTMNIDARTIEGIDLALFDRIIREYGSDSDMARVDVYGQFPKQGDGQFISRALVEGAGTRELFPDHGAPLIMGCDIARQGSDDTVVFLRKGRDARSVPSVRWNGLDLKSTANRIADLINRHNPDVVVVDANGIGAGVVDILRSYRYRIREEMGQERAEDNDHYGNRRVELWGRMKDWLSQGCTGNSESLLRDLLSPEYTFNASGKLMLESKERMRARGCKSPDEADALSLTFAVNPARKDSNRMYSGNGVVYPIGFEPVIL